MRAIEREVSVATLAASALGGKIEILCIYVRLVRPVSIIRYVGTNLSCRSDYLVIGKRT